MRTALCGVAMLLAQSLPGCGATPAVGPERGADLPEPNFDRIDYAHPERYVDLPASLGKRTSIERAAAEIKAATPRETLAAIDAWIDAHLEYDDHAPNVWRDFDRILADGTYGGCADHSLVFGALSRASGIPTVWVKTMDADWVRRFRRTADEGATWSGHVFLEVHLDGKWALLDATEGVLHTDYDVRQRILPGARFAYDKGGDPYGVVLSSRWEDWKKQTRAHFSTFDLAQLPVADGMPLRASLPWRSPPPWRASRPASAPRAPSAPRPSVFVAGNNPEWSWAAERCSALGFAVGRSGNVELDQWMPLARGQVLVVTCLGGATVLGDAYPDLVPQRELEEALASKAAGSVRRTASDGTRVIVVFGRDAGALRAEIEVLTLDDSTGAKE